MHIKPIPKGEALVSSDGDQYDTITAMKNAAHFSAQAPLIKEFVRRNNLQKKDLSRLYNCLYKFLEFERDDGGTQTIRTAARTIRDKKGNCVDYSVLLGAFLINMGQPFSFRMVSFGEDENYAHIYPVLSDGTPIDLVLGKEDDFPAKYGTQVPYSSAKDLTIN